MSITDIFPVSYPSAGTIRVQAWLTAANPAAPTLAEITASSSLDATCYFPAEAFSITHEQERLDDTRLCDATSRESFGRSTFAIESFSYIWAPSAPAAATPGNLAYTTFTPGSTLYLGVRFGTAALLAAAPIAATQRLDIYALRCGDRNKQILAGEGAKHLIVQQTALTRLAVDYAVPAA